MSLNDRQPLDNTYILSIASTHYSHLTFLVSNETDCLLDTLLVLLNNPKFANLIVVYLF
jgi:hypothetical protein